MVILIPYCDELLTPMAIVDGFLPEKESLVSACRLYSQTGLPRNHENLSAMHTFRDLSLSVNAMEARPAHKQIRPNLHQYLIRYKGTVADVVKAVEHRGGPLLNRLGKVLSDALDPNYCINIIADPHTRDFDRLRQYVFFWISATRFGLTEKSQFTDYDGYVQLCDELFSRIDRVYSDPIGAGLETLVRTENTMFSGERING